MPWTGRSKQEQKQNSQQYFKNKDQQCSMPWTGLCKQEQKQLLQQYCKFKDNKHMYAMGRLVKTNTTISQIQ